MMLVAFTLHAWCHSYIGESISLRKSLALIGFGTKAKGVTLVAEVAIV